MHAQSLAVEWIAIDRVFPNPANPRVNDPAVEPVGASLRRFGWQQPIVAKRSGEIVAGHTRLKAARGLGMGEVPVVWFEGSDLDAAAYSIADNRTHEFATWDDAALVKILEELRAEDALTGVGSTDAQIDENLRQVGMEGTSPIPLDDPGPGEVPEKSLLHRGEVWLLGDHRLMCGDSTSPEDVAQLLAGDRGALLSTDPPYCVDYTGNDRPIHDGKPSGKDWSHVYHEVDIKDLGEFLDRTFDAWLPYVEPNCGVYVWHAHVQQPVIASVFERKGLLLHQILVWVKPCAIPEFILRLDHGFGGVPIKSEIRGRARAHLAQLVIGQPGRDHSWRDLWRTGIEAGYWTGANPDSIRRQGSRIQKELHPSLMGYWQQSAAGVRWTLA